jgi:2-polyprenyl-3-methyl-5-hydroxy-6-metoxy-1,4-benzoquinol methylase
LCPDRLGHNRTVLHESYDAVIGDHVLHHTEAWRDVVREAAARVVWP